MSIYILYGKKGKILVQKSDDNNLYPMIEVKNEVEQNDLLRKKLAGQTDTLVEYFVKVSDNDDCQIFRGRLCIKENGIFCPIDLRKIKVVLGAESSSHIILCDGSKKTVSRNLAYMETKLPNDYFVRIHKSYIVNIEHITKFTKTRVTVGDKDYPIGRTYKRMFAERMNLLIPIEVFCRESKRQRKIQED